MIEKQRIAPAGIRAKLTSNGSGFTTAQNATLVRANAERDEKIRLLELAGKMSGVGYWRLTTASGLIEWSDEVYAIHGVDKTTFNPNLDEAIQFYHADDQPIVTTHCALCRKAVTTFNSSYVFCAGTVN